MMNNSKKINEGSLNVNPFTSTLQIKASKGTSLSKFKLSANTDKILLNDSFLIEKQNSTKIYHSKENEDVISQLSPTAIKLIFFIANRLSKNKDSIQLNKSLFMAKYNVKSINTYKHAVKELIQHRIIAYAQENNTYFINPSFLFNGNRIEKYPKNIKIISDIFTT